MKSHFRIQTSRFLVSAVLLMAGAGTATAEDDTLADLLAEKGVITADERDEIKGDEPAADGEADVPQAEEEKQPNAVIKLDHKGLAITSGDGRFKAAFGGRLQFDAGGFIEDVNRLGAGAEVRRGRIKSYGYVYDNWHYKLEVNFDTDLQVPITDGWIKYAGFKPFTITIGHQKVPFGQQSMTSSNWQVFQERALPDAFVDNPVNGRRALGAVIGSYGDHWNVYWGMFAEGVALSGQASADFATAGRAVFAPIAEATRVLTVGGSVYYRNFNGDPDLLRVRAQPESHIAGIRLADTGFISNGIDEVLFNFDASMVFGPVHAQAEYTGQHVNRRGAPNVFFQGYYVQAGWFITGESRNYDVKSGKYKRLTPSRSIGAWEVAVRWSNISLQDEDILGGRENNFTTGVNWWVNQSVAVRFNYVYAMLRPNSDMKDPMVLPNYQGGIDENIHAFQARFQLVF